MSHRMPTLLALSVCLALGTSACATTGDQPVHSHKPTAPAHTPPSADALTEARVHDLGHIDDKVHTAPLPHELRPEGRLQLYRLI